LPLFAQLLGGPAIVITLVSAGMLLLTLAKRLQANGRPLPATDPERKTVILRRLFLDRDIQSHSDWIQRRPDEPTSRQSETG
jgi:hypothetical protein